MTGNAPGNRQDLLDALKQASERGVVIVNISQCAKGFVTDKYATGKVLSEHGVSSGNDMTTEAALTKLSYLIGKDYSPDQCRKLISQNMRGKWH